MTKSADEIKVLDDVEVTQADRLVAAELLGGAAPDGLLEGVRDSLSLVQALARHRIASTIPDPAALDAAEARGYAAAVTVLRGWANGFTNRQTQVTLRAAATDLERNAPTILAKLEARS